MKKLIWVMGPALLLLAGILWLFNSAGGTYPLPKVLDSNDKGLLLSLPVVAMEKDFTWQPAHVPASEPGQQAVQQALTAFVDGLNKPLPRVEVVAQAGLESREQYAQRVADALAAQGVGKLALQANDPQQRQVGVVMKCAIADSVVAQRLLGALAPYLGGRVALMYTDLPAGDMVLELWGTPFFNSQGQATFDPNLINME